MKSSTKMMQKWDKLSLIVSIPQFSCHIAQNFYILWRDLHNHLYSPSQILDKPEDACKDIECSAADSNYDGKIDQTMNVKRTTY